MDDLVIIKHIYLIALYLIIVLLAILSALLKKNRAIFSILSIILLSAFLFLEVINGASYSEEIVLIIIVAMILLSRIKIKEENA